MNQPMTPPEPNDQEPTELERIEALEVEIEAIRTRANRFAQAAAAHQRRADQMQSLLEKLHVAAKFGTTRSGALEYIRQELLAAFKDTKQPKEERPSDDESATESRE